MQLIVADFSIADNFCSNNNKKCVIHNRILMLIKAELFVEFMFNISL